MSGNENDRPDGIRVGDQEREEAVRRLGEHYEAGRLTAEEHTERVGEALRSKTQADLAALFTDLPGGAKKTADEQDRTGKQQGFRGGPPWAHGAKGWRGIPAPILAALVGFALLASIACTIAGGHPPVLLFLVLTVGAVVFFRRRTHGRQA